MLTFHSTLATNQDHLSAIGRVAVQWTMVEKTLEVLVWELAPLRQPNAQAVTTHISFLMLVDMAKALANERLKETAFEARLKVQLDHIAHTLRPKRNGVVHGIWGPTIEPAKVVLLETTARGAVKHKVGTPMAAEDILAIAAEIDQASFEFQNLVFDISAHLGQVTNIDSATGT